MTDESADRESVMNPPKGGMNVIMTDESADLEPIGSRIREREREHERDEREHEESAT